MEADLERIVINGRRITRETALSVWRRGATLDRAQFCIIASAAPYDWFTRGQAIAFASGSALPPVFRRALNAAPDDETEIKLLASPRFSRAGSLLEFMRAAIASDRGSEVSVAELDQVFRDGVAV